jgi:hypothetical protein
MCGAAGLADLVIILSIITLKMNLVGYKENKSESNDQAQFHLFCHSACIYLPGLYAGNLPHSQGSNNH